MPQGGISRARLGQMALEIISLKTFYENALQHGAPGEKEQLTQNLKRLDELERLVARLNLLRRIKLRAPVTDALGAPPKVSISP